MASKVLCMQLLEVEQLAAWQVGKRNRAVGETRMNRDSSRSHAIFAITVERATRSANNSVCPWYRRPCATRPFFCLSRLS